MVGAASPCLTEKTACQYEQIGGISAILQNQRHPVHLLRGAFDLHALGCEKPQITATAAAKPVAAANSNKMGTQPSASISSSVAAEQAWNIDKVETAPFVQERKAPVVHTDIPAPPWNRNNRRGPRRYSPFQNIRCKKAPGNSSSNACSTPTFLPCTSTQTNTTVGLTPGFWGPSAPNPSHVQTFLEGGHETQEITLDQAFKLKKYSSEE